MSRKPVPAEKTWLLGWIANAETPQRLRAAGLEFIEAAQARLQTAPQETMRRIFEHGYIPMNA